MRAENSREGGIVTSGAVRSSKEIIMQYSTLKLYGLMVTSYQFSTFSGLLTDHAISSGDYFGISIDSMKVFPQIHRNLLKNLICIAMLMTPFFEVSNQYFLIHAVELPKESSMLGDVRSNLP